MMFYERVLVFTFMTGVSHNDQALFTSVVLTGGPPRPEKTVRALQSLNEQTFKGIQKILINNARPDEEIDYLRRADALTADWEVIQFSKSEYKKGDYGSVWRVPGNRALDIAKGKYIFFQSDDDFLAPDFFEKISALFDKYPIAICGSGTSVEYIWETGEFRTKSGSWLQRPEIESGRSVIHKSHIDSSYIDNQTFSLVMEIAKVKEVRDYIFEAGFPETNCLYQVGLRGYIVFDSSAKMYWGKHNGQDNRSWKLDNVLYSSNRFLFDSILRCNFLALQKFVPDSQAEWKLLRKSFNSFLAQRSTQILFDRFLQKIRLIPTPVHLIGKKIDVGSHLVSICRNPSQAILSIWQVFTGAISGGIRKFFGKRVKKNH